MLINILSFVPGVIYLAMLLADIHEQRKTQKKVASLYENLKSHQDTCNALNHKLSEIVNDQSTFNESVTRNIENQWLAIHIIVNRIKERE